jgi:hypothetical protein
MQIRAIRRRELGFVLEESGQRRMHTRFLFVTDRNSGTRRVSENRPMTKFVIMRAVGVGVAGDRTSMTNAHNAKKTISAASFAYGFVIQADAI